MKYICPVCGFKGLTDRHMMTKGITPMQSVRAAASNSDTTILK
ncbi:hypothetical protein [Bacillus halotolerans]|nr:hypothetical protein [Bacillus halotolerans]